MRAGVATAIASWAPILLMTRVVADARRVTVAGARLVAAPTQLRRADYGGSRSGSRHDRDYGHAAVCV